MPDQITVKVHNFTKNYVDDILDQLKNAGVNFKSEKALYSVAILRLKQEADNVKWDSKRSVDVFLEGILNDLYYLQDSKIVKTSMRGFAQV